MANIFQKILINIKIIIQCLTTSIRWEYEAKPGEPVVYLLVDPITKKCHYVGRTCDPFQRLSAHIGMSRLYSMGNNKEKNRWINELKIQNLLPIMIIVDSARDKNNEYRWIGKMLEKRHPLTNKQLLPA